MEATIDVSMDESMEESRVEDKGEGKGQGKGEGKGEGKDSNKDESDSVDIALLIQGDRRTLAKAITLVESVHPQHRLQAQQLLQQLTQRAPQRATPAIRLGISGPPGVGKSTFIEALGEHLIAQQLRVAILTIDPSSSLSGGSLLGDKTRMGKIAHHPDVYIRPSPNAQALGGINRATHASIQLCEAAGYDVVLVETVGAGQSESDVAWVTDLLLLLIEPGGGDGLQGIKKGLLEMIDLLVVTKADGDKQALAEKTRLHYQQALQLSPVADQSGSAFSPGDREIFCCSAVEKKQLPTIWDWVHQRWSHLRKEKQLHARRQAKQASWLQRLMVEQLMWRLQQDPVWADKLTQLQSGFQQGTLSVEQALDQFYLDLLKPSSS